MSQDKVDAHKVDAPLMPWVLIYSKDELGMPSYSWGIDLA